MNAQQFKQEIAPLQKNLLNVARKMLENENDAENLVTDVNRVTIDAGFSHEWFFNICGATIPIYQNNLGISSGLGMSWLNLRLDKNTRLTDVDGVTDVYPTPEGIHFTTSRLMIVRINVPLLFEWQPAIQGRNKAFLSAGIVAGVKTFSSYLVKYKEGNKTSKEKYKGLNTTPLSLRLYGTGKLWFFGDLCKIFTVQHFSDKQRTGCKSRFIGINFVFQLISINDLLNFTI